MNRTRVAGYSLFALSLFASGSAMSQQPGSAGYNSVYLPAHGVGDTTRTRWEDRWGAYAVGQTDPAIGLATSGAAFNLRSNEEAEREAMSVCARRGGIQCAIMAAAKNNCMVVGSGETQGYRQTHDTLRKARQGVLRQCGRNCQILWEGCGFPVRQ